MNMDGASSVAMGSALVMVVGVGPFAGYTGQPAEADIQAIPSSMDAVTGIDLGSSEIPRPIS